MCRCKSNVHVGSPSRYWMIRKTLLITYTSESLKVSDYRQFCFERQFLFQCLSFSLTGEIVQYIAYGESYDGDVDLVKLGDNNMRNIGKVIRGYYVDIIPWCELPEPSPWPQRRAHHDVCPLLIVKYVPGWFPGAKFQHEAKSIKAELEYSRWFPFNLVKSQVRESL